MTNPYGDVELDARGMRALAHPVRLTILQRLRAGGPDTATRLAPQVGCSPSVVSWHLRHLAEHGLVRDADRQGPGRQRWWEAVRGFRFVGADDESDAAARALTSAIEQVEGDVPGRWRDAVEPQLEPEWRRAASRTDTTILVTVSELERLEGDIEALLIPYVLRRTEPGGDQPAGMRPVRILRHTLPGLPEHEG